MIIKMCCSDILFLTRHIKMLATALAFFMITSINSFAFDLPGSDQIPFHHLSVEDGLSQVTVNDIAQDENGFLWFATEDGLNRYDGKNFVVYQKDTDTEHRISGNIINFVFNDSQNRLWAGTNGQGINLKIENTFISIPIFINGESVNTIKATVLFEDRENNLWLGTWGDGLFKYSEKDKQFNQISSNPNYTRIWDIAQLEEEKILIGTYNHGIAKLNNNQLIPWLPANALATISVKVLYTEQNQLWIGTEDQGLWKYISMATELQQIKKHPGLMNAVVHEIYRDQLGSLWIGTLGEGLFKFENNKHWVHQSADNENESLSNNKVFSLFQDSSGVFWVGTEGAGLNFYDPYSLIFRNIRQGNNIQKNLNDKMVYAIASDSKNNWWFGTESGGVNHWDSKNKHFNYYTVESGHLHHNTVRALLPTNLGVFVGTLNGFSLISNTGELIYKWNTENLPQLTDSTILSFEQVENSKIWIGTVRGLFLFDVISKSITNTLPGKQIADSYQRRVILSLLHSDGQLWVGTYSRGLYSYGILDDSLFSFHHDNNISDSIGSESISSLFKDSQKQLWIGTNGAGLQKLNSNSGLFTQIDKRAGLANNVVYGILEDANQNIWMSTNSGLSRYNPQLETVKNYSPSDGIQGREFNSGAYHHHNNIMAFGGINGVSWFDDSTQLTNPFSPQTQITNIRILNKNISQFNDAGIHLKKHQDLPKLLSLDYDKTMFTVEFAALHFSSPQQNSFKYRMIGLDNNWIDSVGSQSEATYTGLPPGSYQFQVIAISKDGLADKSPAILDIILLPPPWKTWWAYSIYLLLSFLFFWRYLAFLKRKLAFQKNLNEGLKKIDQLKERLVETEKMAVLGELSSNVAHSLRNPLASIRTSAELLEDDTALPDYATTDAKNIITEVDRLSSWIKELLAYSKDQSSNMEPMDLVTSCKNILDNYNDKSLNTKIHFEFSSNINRANIEIDPILFQHLLNSLIDNAIEAILDEGTITLTIESVNTEKVKLTLSDSGIGIAFAQQTQIFDSAYSSKPNGLGMGLSLVKRIVERHNADITVSSEPNKGTQFTLTFNLPQE